MSKNKKTSYDLMREIRGTWTIDPRTRIHDNDTRKNKKRNRQEGKNTTRNAMKEYI